MANDRAGIEAAGTWAPRALGHLLFSKKRKTPLGSRALGHSGKCLFKKKQPLALGHSGTCSFPKKKKNTLGQLGTQANARFQKTVMGTRALRHSSKNYQKTIKKTIQRLSKRLSVTIYIPKMIVSSVRSSNSHPDLLVTHQHQQHPTFSDNTLVLENNTF